MPSTFEDMKKQIETGWDIVLWSESYGMADAAQLIACTFLGCAANYLGQQLEDLVAKVGSDLVKQALANKGKIFGAGKFEVEAGDAYWSTYYNLWNPIKNQHEKVTTDRYVRLYIRMRRRENQDDTTDISSTTVSLQNTANTQWKDHYLDIDANTGKVILWPRQASGTYWKLINHGNGTVSLQNTANTQWKDHYLDIDANTGKVILWPRQASGTYWKLINHGNGTVSLQNTANTQWKNHYLDIDANTGEVILWPRQASGTYWKLNVHNRHERTFVPSFDKYYNYDNFSYQPYYSPYYSSSYPYRSYPYFYSLYSYPYPLFFTCL
ncbi:TPA: hypothetical protein ACKU3G_004076 [Bacillus cereus]